MYLFLIVILVAGGISLCGCGYLWWRNDRVFEFRTKQLNEFIFRGAGYWKDRLSWEKELPQYEDMVYSIKWPLDKFVTGKYAHEFFTWKQSQGK